MLRFITRYHEWNCRASNGKRFTAIEHCCFGATGVCLLVVTVLCLVWALMTLGALLFS